MQQHLARLEIQSATVKSVHNSVLTLMVGVQEKWEALTAAAGTYEELEELSDHMRSWRLGQVCSWAGHERALPSIHGHTSWNVGLSECCCHQRALMEQSISKAGRRLAVDVNKAKLCLMNTVIE